MLNKKILAIDTSDHVCAVAISNNNEVVVSKAVGNKLNHSLTLMPLIEEAFLEVDFTVSDLDYIFVTEGPGSFTGIRIGVATAKALAHFNNIPIVPVKTLTNIASIAGEKDGIIVPLIDARRQTFYTQFFDGNYKTAINEIQHLEITDIIETLSKEDRKIYLVGDKLDKLLEDIELSNNISVIDITENIDRAKYILEMDEFLLENSNNFKTYKNVEPYYLKKSQAEREYDEKNGVV